MYWYSAKSMIVFYTVVKNRSFTRAAEILFMTQPGVSIHITQLESELGVKLLNRKSGEFEVTEEGKVIFKCAEKIYKVSMELEKIISNVKGNQHIRLTVGATPTYCKTLLAKIAANFSESYPGTIIKIEAENSDILEKKLLSQEMDIAIAPCYKPSSHILSKPLVTEDLMVIVSHTHELASRKNVSLLDMKEYPIALREEGSETRKIVMEFYRSNFAIPRIGIEVNSTDFIREWVIQNKGFAVVSKTAALLDTRVKAIPIQEKLVMDVCFLCLKSRRYEIPIQKFMQYLINS